MPWTSEFEIETTSTTRTGTSPAAVVRPAPNRSGRGLKHRSGTYRKRGVTSRGRVSRRVVYRRRRIGALIVLLITCAIPLVFALVGVPGISGQARNPAFARVEPPLLSTAPAIAGQELDGGKVPEDKTLFLTVPEIGIYGHTVRNDDSAESLDAGAIKIPETGFPWQDGANTYIAGHRIGYAGTESYYQFLNLPNMKKGDEVILEDMNGARYTYRVFKIFAVEPTDVWVTEPIPGKDVVTLQTCTESVDDWTTLGEELLYSTPDTGRLIVRAERV